MPGIWQPVNLILELGVITGWYWVHQADSAAQSWFSIKPIVRVESRLHPERELL
jgi:hypothetical protein